MKKILKFGYRYHSLQTSRFFQAKRGRFLLTIIVIVVVAGAIWLGLFVRKNWAGIKPVVSAPPEDIVELIPVFQEQKPDEEVGGRAVDLLTNTTGMPLNLMDGFSISIFAKELGKPRVVTYDPLGNMVVSIPKQGRVVALPDKDNNGVADEIVTVIDGLNRPHGLATRCGKESCEFYIAESDQVAVYAYDQESLKALHKRTIVNLPDGGNHFTRTILFLPPPSDGRFLVSVGSSCNVCHEKDWRRAAILAAYADGSDFKVFASGLRNAVFMVTHPITGDVWATEMGRDWLGDDLPPDEIDIVEEDKDYGWPYCYGEKIHDTDFDPSIEAKERCERSEPSSIDVPAHSSPLGLVFIPESASWPEDYWYDLLVAYHGSWNRTVPTGYKIVRHKFDKNGNYEGVEDFITGWLTEEGKALGRPVDIVIHEGAIYISDDKAGVIYKVEYHGQEE
ncbi:PQQ-dependent sugar dehydrogenase [Patescibacteria group bacterium AH-259-L05]|nr:PQQ-dependent sugar dehydrogenase [Patescibacteria group bacterium AH-259-L05]